ncbi:hypothetical protein AgCh_023105 [Apium graveolens]
MSRIKEHYTKYDTDEQRLENRPHKISLDDFKFLMKYWGDEGVKNSIQEVLEEGNTANELLPNGKHGPNWVVGRKGGMAGSENNPTTPQSSAADLKHVTQELEAKFHRKLQENMAWMLKKLGEANPGMKIDIGDFCASESSDHNENDTHFASGTRGTQEKDFILKIHYTTKYGYDAVALRKWVPPVLYRDPPVLMWIKICHYSRCGNILLLSSITNPLSRQRPVMYQNPNVQYAPVQSRVTTNLDEQKITDSRMQMQQQYQDSGYLLPTQYDPQHHLQLQQP